MTIPYQISCTSPAVGLYELPDGRFQLIEQGPISPFMCGYQYLLVERPLAEYLKMIGVEQVRYEPATIWNRKTDLEYQSHTRLYIGQYFKPEQIQDIALDGPRLLTMNDEYIFSSSDLKVQLECGSFPYLHFTEGFSGFAASPTYSRR